MSEFLSPAAQTAWLDRTELDWTGLDRTGRLRHTPHASNIRNATRDRGINARSGPKGPGISRDTSFFLSHAAGPKADVFVFAHSTCSCSCTCTCTCSKPRAVTGLDWKALIGTAADTAAAAAASAPAPAAQAGPVRLKSLGQRGQGTDHTTPH